MYEPQLGGLGQPLITFFVLWFVFCVLFWCVWGRIFGVGTVMGSVRCSCFSQRELVRKLYGRCPFVGEFIVNGDYVKGSVATLGVNSTRGCDLVTTTFRKDRHVASAVLLVFLRRFYCTVGGSLYVRNIGTVEKLGNEKIVFIPYIGPSNYSVSLLNGTTYKGSTSHVTQLYGGSFAR